MGNRWFALVQAVPEPEFGETANVGLIVSDGTRLRVHYDRRFPRLRCMTGGRFNPVYEEALRDLQAQLERGSTMERAAERAGAQLRIGGPVPLLQAPDTQTVKRLMRRFLGVATIKVGRDSAPDSEFDRIMSRLTTRMTAPPGFKYESSVTPRSLYPSLSERSVFKKQVPRLDRAVRYPGKDILLGIVDLSSADDPYATMRNSGSRISRAFWHYRQARPILEVEAGLEVRTVGVILNVAPSDPRAQEAADWLTHIWQGDEAEVVLPQDNAGFEALGRAITA